jgi:hypothetical protein
MQEVWTICRIFRRSLSYKKQPQAAGTVVATTAVVAAQQPGSSSHTGSLESDTGSDEYIMNGIPPQAPMNSQFHGQWNNAGVDVPLLPPASSSQSAFYHGVHSSLDAPYDQYYKDGSSWDDDIGMMVMELIDPSVLYDCTFA